MTDRLVIACNTSMMRDLRATLPIDHPARIQRALDDWLARVWWTWREGHR